MGKLDEKFSASAPVPGDYVHPLDGNFDVGRMVEERGAERWVRALEESQLAEDYRAEFATARPPPRPAPGYSEQFHWFERAEELTDAEKLDFELQDFHEDEEWRQRYLASDDYLNKLPELQPASSIDSSGHVPGPGGSVDTRLPEPTRPPKRKAEDQLFGRANKIARPFQGVEIDYRINHGDGSYRPTNAALKRSIAEDHGYAMPASMDPGPFASVAARDHWAAVIEPRLRLWRARRLRHWACNIQYYKARREAYNAQWAPYWAFRAAYRVAGREARARADAVIQAARGDLNTFS